MKLCLRAAALLALLPALAGCGGPEAHVTGTVTCNGNPVVGEIRFSSKGEDETSPTTSVSAPLGDDGTFKLKIASVGTHRIVITPREASIQPGPCHIQYLKTLKRF